MRIRLALTLSIACYGASPIMCYALNRDALVRLLVPTYVAADVSAICSKSNPELANKKLGRFGTAWEYAQHAKSEVTSEISEEEAAIIRRLAADTAKGLTRNHLASFGSNITEDRLNEHLEKWCEEVGLRLIQNTAKNHDEHHDEILNLIAEAKK